MAPTPDTLAPAQRSIRIESSGIRGWVEAGRLAATGPALGQIVLPFLLILYLALEGGGYDEVVRSEIGVAIWWIVLLGAILGILPAVRVSRAGWIGLAALAAFAVWTGLAIAWSESAERSALELARVATLLGVLTLATLVQGRDGVRRAVYSVGAALALVAGLALLSRLHPSWFPPNDAGVVFESERARLNYPVNYWNGLAALMAIAMPLLLAIAVRARTILARALATAAVPVTALVAFYTLSRGGAIEYAVAVVAFLALYPRRLEALPTVALAGVASALLIAAAAQRDALEDGLTTAAALQQGDEMIVMVLVVCAGVGLLRAALGLAEHHELLPRLRLERRTSALATGTAIATLVVVALATGLPGELSDRWQEFKRPVGPGGSVERFDSASGNGRYQYWEAAIEANATEPLVGIGPGTFEYFWAREGSLPGFVRDAHSLFLEAAAEVGIVGLLLIGGFALYVLAVGVRRSFTAAPEQRPWLAAATAAAIGFMVAVSIDWAWELTVIPVAFMFLAGALLNGGVARHRRARTSGGHRRAALAGAAVAAVVAIALPLAATSAVRGSQEDAGSGMLGPALDSADTASDITPWAATPELQRALVLELQGDLDAAAAAAAAATREEPTNWRTWVIRSRIEAYRGEPEASVAAFRRARELNPRSPLLKP